MSTEMKAIFNNYNKSKHKWVNLGRLEEIAQNEREKSTKISQ